MYGWMLLSKGSHAEAKEPLLEAYASYIRCDNQAGIARALNHLAYIAQMSGDIESAISHLKQCINIYQKIDVFGNGLLFSNNLGLVYFQSGYFAKAISQYQLFENDISKFGKDYQYHYYLRIALSLAHQGHIKQALTQINSATKFDSNFRRVQALYYEYLGWIHILDGNFKQAEKTLLTGLELSMEIAPQSALISQTKRLLADSYLGLKKFELAQKYGQEALIVAEKINERAEIAACYRVFALVCLQDNKNEKASAWYKKAIELFTVIKSRYELAVTRYLYASSGICDNNERSALLYLAEEYFESEEIKPFIDKVNEALTSSVVPKPIARLSRNNVPVFIAKSPKSIKVLEEAERLSRSDLTVLITGPTGSGKDQLAKYMHHISGRNGQYCSVTCACLNESVIESELFGYVKGAFTGADRDKPGLLEKADGGTLCLNEIGDMPERIQIRLLEFLDSKEVRPVGSIEWKKLDVKIIAATNRDLEAAIKAGHFRSDLFYRLNQARIILPPLSERKEDIPVLVKYFLKILGFDIDANGDPKDFDRLCQFLSTYDWPGNVRELESRIKKLHDEAGGDLIRMAAILESETLSERDRLIRILEQTNWNQRQAARRLGIDESTIRYHLKKLKINQ